MSARTLHLALLRPAILHILRAAGFQAAKPSVVDTLTDIAARYIMLLAARSAEFASVNHNDLTPDTTDVRMALVECGLLTPTQTAGEEMWKELLREPLDEVPERNGLRQKEIQRRDAEDTHEIQDFVDWFSGPVYLEIKRIAGLVAEDAQGPAMDGLEGVKPDDYFTGTYGIKHSFRPHVQCFKKETPSEQN
jgi:transcription initiation factor TFIID subunit 3